MAAAASAVVAICVVLLCMGAPVAMAQTCTSTPNSPTQSDAQCCVQSVVHSQSQLCQVNSCCTKVCTYNTADLYICGIQGLCIGSPNAGAFFNQILAACSTNVGGPGVSDWRVSGETLSPPYRFAITRASFPPLCSSPPPPSLHG